MMAVVRIAALVLLSCFLTAQGAKITLQDGGSLGIRPGCPLDVLGAVKLIYPKHEAPCGDADDQADYNMTRGMWTAAGQTWVDTCTAKKTQPMATGCPPGPPALVNGKPYESPINTWTQYYSPGVATLTGNDKGVWKQSLLDIRADRLILKNSIIQFINGFLFMARGGVLVMNTTHVYTEDNADSDMGAAVIGVHAKVSAIASSEFVQQDAVFAWQHGEFSLVKSFFKQMAGATIIENSTFNSISSEVQFWGCKSAHVARSTWNLTATQVTLEESFLHIWDSTIILSQDSAINVHKGSRLLLSNVKIVGDTTITAVEGVPDAYGVGPGGVVDAMNADFAIDGDAATITLGPAALAQANGP